MKFPGSAAVAVLLTGGLFFVRSEFTVPPDQSVICSQYRVTALSDRLARIEYSPQGRFLDRPTFIFAEKTQWPARVQMEEAGDRLYFQFPEFTVRLLLDGKPLSDGNLEITWPFGGVFRSWRPGQPDSTNLLGGGHAFDGLARDHPIPMASGLLNREGYWAVWDDTAAIIDSTLGTLRPKGIPGHQDLFFCVYGDRFAAGIREFVRQSGPAPRLPREAFGLWFSRYWNYYDREVLETADRFRKEEIPLSIFVVDVDWHRHGWDGYEWNPEYFPAPTAFLDSMHARGARVMLNVHPEKLSREDGHFQKVVEKTGDQKEASYFVFNTMKRAHVEAFGDVLLKGLFDQKVDYLWSDGHLLGAEGADPTGWSNAIFFGSHGRHASAPPMIMSRAGGLGSHRTPIFFSGDVHSQWEALSFEVDLTARAANTGPVYWSHDLGGFTGRHLPADLYVRWIQFGALSPIMRLHSSFGVREPWEYGLQVLGIFKRYAALRSSLVPYLYSLSEEARRTGLALARPLYFGFPGDAGSYLNHQEYLLGEGLLVAPVCSPQTGKFALREIYLPPGNWYDFNNGRKFTGGKTVSLAVPLEDFPLFASSGTIIPLATSAGQDTAKLPRRRSTMTLRIFPGDSGRFDLFEDAMTTGFRYSESASGMLLECRSTAPPENGEFKKRAYTLMFLNTARPKKVWLGEKPLTANLPQGKTWHYREYTPGVGTLEVFTADVDVRNPWTVRVEGGRGVQKPQVPLKTIELEGRLFSEPNMGGRNILAPGCVPGPDSVKFTETPLEPGSVYLDVSISGLDSVTGVDITPPPGWEVTGRESLWSGKALTNATSRTFSRFRFNLKLPAVWPVGRVVIPVAYRLPGERKGRKGTVSVDFDFLQRFRLLGPFPYAPDSFPRARFGPENETVEEGEYAGKQWRIQWRENPSELFNRFIDLKSAFHIYGFESGARLTGEWKDVKALQQAIYPNYFAAGYAVIHLFATRAGAAGLTIGTVEDFVLEVNGEKAAERKRPAADTFEEKKCRVRLKKGWNRVLLKIGQVDRLWEFYMGVEEFPREMRIFQSDRVVTGFSPGKSF